MMRKITCWSVTTALLLNCTYGTIKYYDYQYYVKTQTIVISERVGEEIDPEERRKFDLFGGIVDFKTATFYGIEEGGYNIEIITEDKKFLAVNRDPMAVEILRDYIDRFEELENDRLPFEGKWQIIDYDTLGQPITQREVNNRSNRGAACLFGGIAGGLLGFFPSLYLGFAIARGRSDILEKEFGTIFTVIAVGLVTSVIAGAAMGSEIGKGNTIKKIKESRKPRVVE